MREPAGGRVLLTMVRSVLVSRRTDPDYVCGECGALALVKVWALYVEEFVDPVSHQTFRECSRNPDHVEPPPRRAPST